MCATAAYLLSTSSLPYAHLIFLMMYSRVPIFQGKLGCFWFSCNGSLQIILIKATYGSFLAGVFTRKEQHLLIMALKIAETSLQKLSDVFLNFMKEGVFFAIDALLKPEETSHKMFPAYGIGELLLDSSQRLGSKGTPKCFCYAMETVKPKQTSESVACKLEKDAVRKLAMHISTSFFSAELCSSEGAIDVLQKLRGHSAALIDLSGTSRCSQYEEDFHSVLSQIMKDLCGQEPISTFEFIESGILKSLVSYLSYGLSMHDKDDRQMESLDLSIVEKRFDVFARLLLSSSEAFDEELPLVRLTRRLQRALSSLENFPVILSSSKQRSSFAMVPHARCLSYPCLKVRFLKEEGEADLSDYSQDAVTVDPFTSLDSIERYLYHKLTRKGKKGKKYIVNREKLIPGHSPMDASSSQEESPETDGTPIALPEVKVWFSLILVELNFS